MFSPEDIRAVEPARRGFEPLDGLEISHPSNQFGLPTHALSRRPRFASCRRSQTDLTHISVTRSVIKGEANIERTSETRLTMARGAPNGWNGFAAPRTRLELCKLSWATNRWRLVTDPSPGHLATPASSRRSPDRKSASGRRGSSLLLASHSVGATPCFTFVIGNPSVGQVGDRRSSTWPPCTCPARLPQCGPQQCGQDDTANRPNGGPRAKRPPCAE